jgi:hypothetical protein
MRFLQAEKFTNATSNTKYSHLHCDNHEFKLFADEQGGNKSKVVMCLISKRYAMKTHGEVKL